MKELDIIIWKCDICQEKATYPFYCSEYGTYYACEKHYDEIRQYVKEITN